LNDFNRGNTRSYSFQSKYKGDEIKIQATTLSPKYDPVKRRNIYILAGILLGLIPAFIARKKGRSFAVFWIYSFFLPIVAIPHALIMKGRS
jgi:uncharacterized membrane protein